MMQKYANNTVEVIRLWAHRAVPCDAPPDLLSDGTGNPSTGANSTWHNKARKRPTKSMTILNL